MHYSYRTGQQYVFWVRRFILFEGKRHAADMVAAEVEAFLTTHLAVERRVSVSTRNQVLAALLFLYQGVLQVELPWLTASLLPGAGLRLRMASSARCKNCRGTRTSRRRRSTPN